MVIKIQKISDDGKARDYDFEFQAAWADYYFTLPNKRVTPALRIIKMDSREFHITGLVDLEGVAKRAQVQENILIQASDFDASAVDYPEFSDKITQAYLVTVFKKLPYHDWKKAFSNGVDFDLLRRTVPTPCKPRGASKLQYLQHYFTA